MRWFRLGLAGRRVRHDPDRQRELLREVRERFGGHVHAPFAEQAEAVARLLDDDDGLVVAAGLLGEFADAAYADLLAQAGDLHRRTGHGPAVDRRNYRPLWQAAGARLRWSLFALPGGLHPYVQIAAAATVCCECGVGAIVGERQQIIFVAMRTLNSVAPRGQQLAQIGRVHAQSVFAFRLDLRCCCALGRDDRVLPLRGEQRQRHAHIE